MVVEGLCGQEPINLHQIFASNSAIFREKKFSPKIPSKIGYDEEGAMEVRFSKWFRSVKNAAMNLFLSISMAYNVISCIKVAKTLKF